MSRRQADHICPPFIGYCLLANPLRRPLYTPKSVLASYISEGMTVIEPGSGMGFFTIELARLVGPNGRVIAIDIQAEMLRVLTHRAEKAGLLSRIDLRRGRKHQPRHQRLAGQGRLFSCLRDGPRSTKPPLVLRGGVRFS